MLFNCFDLPQEAIDVTSEWTSAEFMRHTKNQASFLSRLQDTPYSFIKDLLYCGEMMRDGQFPYVDHEGECVVCMNRTADQLVNFIKERGIVLDHDVLRANKISGRHILFSSFPEFAGSGLPKADVLEALDRLRALHEEILFA